MYWHSKIFFFLIFIAFIPILQNVFGFISFSGDSIISSFYIFGFFIAFIVAYHLLSKSKRNNVFKWLYWVVLIVSIISVWIQLRQWLLFEGNIWTVDLPPNGRPFANFGQPNNCATFLCMGLMACLYLYEKIYSSLLWSIACEFYSIWNYAYSISYSMGVCTGFFNLVVLENSIFSDAIV